LRCGREAGFHWRYAIPVKSKIDSITPGIEQPSITWLGRRRRSGTFKTLEIPGVLNEFVKMVLARRHERREMKEGFV
jgi:hypothetical protein